MRCFVLARVVVVVVVVFASCMNDDFAPASYVSGLRVLAVRAAPPEVAPGQTTTLTVLSVDTEGQAVTLRWFRCLARPLASEPIAEDCVTGADPTQLMPAGESSPLTYTMPEVTAA